MTRKIIRAAVFIALFSTGVFAQTPTATAEPTPAPSVETIINEAAKQTLHYREEFTNLLAVETKTFEKFDKNGAVKDRTTVESNFFVYQSPKAKGFPAELRNVVKVDDRPVPDSQTRADRFLSELQKTTTAEKELEKIRDESLRYDKSFKVSGFTLYEGIALADNLRPFFEFKLLGTETVEGGEVFVVAYRQTKKTPFITVNETPVKSEGLTADFDVSVPGALKKTDKFLSGKLWIDAKTFQVRREQRQVVVQSVTPLVALDTTLEYQPSEFGIFVPKRIVFIENAVKKTSKENEYNVSKNLQVMFDYSKFRKTDTDVKIIDDDGK